MATDTDFKYKTILTVCGYLREIEAELLSCQKLKLIPLKDICSVILIYYRINCFKWSNEFKGKNIFLSDDDTKATTKSYDQSIRTENAIIKDCITSWIFTMTLDYLGYAFLGVVSSETKVFLDRTAWKGNIHNFYGLDQLQGRFCYNSSIKNNKYKPEFPINLTHGPATFKLKVTADYKTYDSCVLSFYYQDKFIPNENNGSLYTIKLPILKKGQDWFPCVAFYNHASVTINIE